MYFNSSAKIRPAVMVGLYEMEAVTAAFNEIAAGKQELKDLKIVSVKDIKAEGTSVLVLTVPYKQINAFHNAQAQFLPDLEKKLNAQVCIVGQHRAFPKTPEHGRRFKAIRNYGRTLRSVNDAILDDLVFPTAIVGKRIHYDVSGKQQTRVILDKHDATRVEERLNGFGAAYNRLTGLNTVFEVAQN
ncbi:40S ribosomal protein S7, putative [Trichomonas vaginalis G3]|uniref:40S ribosomal protein S7 n=1 Tax=Trichomonas vaginalis (strain ATCC PRA-98 / G3) TaxID=412133 RepID=A2DDU5_TRIV3|nr:structural constituent of ribosome [Trichomonas vaginalis G3]EAY21471.1 40S ribosomal protein S7, putative [Trichomonas vaginalis G3]KAI5490684.1 structural constituent of ribosome [Trichomonas vaginalis G3]|eukprot:XP_001582457.1 40S ribosomal protein S7 [Trichomonas vaginalis G3]